MAANTTLLSNLQEAMKVIFADPVHYNVVTDSELMSAFETDSNVKVDTTTGGRYIETSQYFQLPAGVGSRADGDYIPEPQNPVFKNARIYLRKVMGTIQMSGDTMRRVTGDEGAFLDYADRALPDLVTRLTNEMDRICIGFGAGIKAQINGSVTANGSNWNVPLKNAFGVSGLTNPHRLFLEGDTLVFSSTAAGTALRNAGASQSATVVEVDEANTRVVCSMAAGLQSVLADGDYIFPGDGAGSSSQSSGTNREPMGLFAAVDDGNIVDTYCNIQRTASGNRLWKAVMVDGSVAPWSGNLTDGLLVYADDTVAESGAGKFDFVVSSRKALRNYWDDLKTDRRLNNPSAYIGGKGALQVILTDRQIGLKASRKLSPEVAFLLQTDTFRRFTLGSWTWDDTTGSIWRQVTDSSGRKDEFYAYGYLYEELFCSAPRKNGRINSLSGSTP